MEFVNDKFLDLLGKEPTSMKLEIADMVNYLKTFDSNKLKGK